MLNSTSVMQLYATVLQEDIKKHRIPEVNIRSGIQNMAFVYKPDATRFDDAKSVSSNFNIPAFRCAYLHKYAPLHTFIVIDVMLRIAEEKMTLFQNFLKSGQFKLCCLGAGPGSDAIGVLAVFYSTLHNFKSTVTLVDSMSHWELTFTTIIRELVYGEYGSCWKNIKGMLEWNYVEANLLWKMTDEVNKSIGSASFITMVKFISAAICKDTESMVEKIFRVMKPGAFLLYVDNAAGGFTQIIERAAKKNNLEIIVGPLRHLEYENESLKIDRFGYTSCYKTTVTVILLQKAYYHDQSIKQGQLIPERSEQKVYVPNQQFLYQDQEFPPLAFGQGAYEIFSAEAGVINYAFDKPDSLPYNVNARSSVQTDEQMDKIMYPSNRNRSSVQTDEKIDKIVYPRILYPSNRNANKSFDQTGEKIDKLYPSNRDFNKGKENSKDVAGSSNFNQPKVPMKQNNLDKVVQNSYSRAKKNFATTPYSVIESQPTDSSSTSSSGRNSSAEYEPESNCCACCVIS